MSAISKSQINRKEYTCKTCDYNSFNKYDYEKHINTIKHNTNILAINCDKLSQTLQEKQFLCSNCNKEYKDNSGLWRHKKKCCIENNNISLNIDDIDKTKDLKEFMQYLIKENSEMKTMMMEVIKNGVTNNTTNNTTTNSNNKTFNLQFFLNETCKDALSITEFVNSLQLKIQDLEETGRLGYVQGITRIFLNGLKDLDINERPLHCSDAKREVIYIKDTNQWVKDNDTKDKLTLAIKTIANQNIKQISNWQKTNPNYNESDSKKNNLYLKIVSNAMSGGTEAECIKNYNTIITNIAKETIIEKDNL